MKCFFRLLILYLIALFSLPVCAKNPVLVKVFEITEFEFHEKYIAIGELEKIGSKAYFAKVNGVVDYVVQKQNAEILRDEILISIDSEIAEQSKLKAEANLALAKSNYTRDLSLFKKKIISEEVVNASKAALESTKNDYITTLDRYSDMIIKSPYNAYVGVIRAKIGDEIQVGDYLFSLITDSDFYSFIEVPQNMRGRILTTDIVNTYVDGKTIKGKILAISDYVSSSGTITAKLQFPGNNLLTHGTFIENEIIFNKHKNLGIPEKAVLKNNMGDFIYVITPDNKAKQIFVKLGVRTNNMIELATDGLNMGDKVVIEGLTKIYDGADVIINDDIELSE